MLDVPHAVKHLQLGVGEFTQTGVASGQRDCFYSSSSRRFKLSNGSAIQAVRRSTPDVALTKNREDIDILLGIKNLEYQ